MEARTKLTRSEQIEEQLERLEALFKGSDGCWISKHMVGGELNLDPKFTNQNQLIQNRMVKIKKRFLQQGRSIVNEPRKGYRICHEPDIIMAESIKALERAMGHLNAHLAIALAATDSSFEYPQLKEVIRATETIQDSLASLARQAKELGIKINTKPEFVQQDIEMLNK